MKKILVSMLLLAMLSTPLMARCPDPVGQKPLWTSKVPKETDVSYFRVIFTEGQTLTDAREQARTEVHRGHSSRVSESIRILDAETFSDNNFEVKYDIVCEYHKQYKNGSYGYWQLAQIAKNPTYALPPVPPSAIEGEGVGLRPFIPGMAQFYKESNAKGVMFIVGETLLIGGVATAEFLRSSAASKMKTAHNAARWQEYRNDADNMQNARNILIGGAIAVYAWNVIDGFVAKGPGNRLSVDLRSDGLALALNF